jgi:hypothetical protein
MAKRNGRNKGTGVSVDLSGVETGSRKAIPEGTYPVTVDSIELKKSDNSGGNYLSFTFEVEEGTHKGSKLFHNCSLQPQALFNLKSVLLALGFEIPNKAFDLDTTQLVGLSCLVEVSHEVYEGKKKARITDFINPEDSDDDGEDSDFDLEELEKDELVELAKALKITAKKIKGAKTEEALIELIEAVEDWEETAEEMFGEEDSDDNEEDETEETPELEDLELDSLKELAKYMDIPAKKMKKAKTEEAIIAVIQDSADEDEIEEAIEHLFGVDSDDDGGEDDDTPDYEEMSLKDLKALAKERGIKITKKDDKDSIIEKLEEDDEE